MLDATATYLAGSHRPPECFGRPLWHFEAPLDAGGGVAAPAEAVGAADPGPDPVDAAPAETDGLPSIDELFAAPAPQEPEPWAGPSRAEWEQVAQSSMSLAQMIAQEEQRLAAAQGGQQNQLGIDPDQWDPFDPQQVAQLVQSQVAEATQQAIQQALGPMAPALEQVAVQQGEAAANQHFDHIEARIGAFDREMALTNVRTLLAQGVPGPQALVQAAQQAKEAGDRLMRQGAEAYRARLAAVGQAPPDPAAGAGAAQTVVEESGAGSAYRRQASATLSRLRPSTPTSA